MRKCSMCGSYKEDSEFKYKNKQHKYNAYCNSCQKLYMKEYMRIYRERQKK